MVYKSEGLKSDYTVLLYVALLLLLTSEHGLHFPITDESRLLAAFELLTMSALCTKHSAVVISEL